MFPVIELEGGPRERGRAYGSACGDAIARSIDGYEAAFRHYAGWEWDRVRAEAGEFRAPIAEFEPDYVEEIEGIAEGAEVVAEDVLALNVRTEIMFAATARDADARRRLPAECSALAILPSRSGGETLLAQNWDWLPHAAETTVLLEVRQDDRPNYVTCVEAGMLAKFGLNSAGIALATNALVSDADRGRPGVPFHVLLRSVLDCETLSDALTALMRCERSSSANFVLADRDGLAIDVEAAPGDYSRCYLIQPADGLLLHTNHFLSEHFDGRDVSVLAMPDSPFRLQRLRGLVDDQDGRELDAAFAERALADHAGFPFGICCHPDLRAPEPERSLTLAAVVIDVAARRMRLAPGNPCETPFIDLDFGELLSKPSPVREPGVGHVA